jgi:hypothetical protein
MLPCAHRQLMTVGTAVEREAEGTVIAGVDQQQSAALDDVSSACAPSS